MELIPVLSSQPHQWY